MSADLDLTCEWLEKAQHDLEAAEVLLALPKPMPDVACFHCQQAIEKSLKAFLVYRRISFERSHLLAYVLSLCSLEEPAFEGLRTKVEPLSLYAVEARYPTGSPEPTAEDATAALSIAHEVWTFVLAFLPPEAHPEPR